MTSLCPTSYLWPSEEYLCKQMNSVTRDATFYSFRLLWRINQLSQTLNTLLWLLLMANNCTPVKIHHQSKVLGQKMSPTLNWTLIKFLKKKMKELSIFWRHRSYKQSKQTRFGTNNFKVRVTPRWEKNWTQIGIKVKYLCMVQMKMSRRKN